FNEGGGAFGTHLEYPLEAFAGPIVAADVDGDGLQDLVAGGFFLRNKGRRTFEAPAAYGYDRSYEGPLLVSDGDGQGKPDIITGAGRGISVGRNLGDGSFAKAVQYDLGFVPSDPLVLSDLNGDGLPDLAAAGWVCPGNVDCHARVSVLLNHGGGAFGGPAT